MIKRHVSRAQLNRLFQEHGVWQAIRTGGYALRTEDKKRIPVRQGHLPAGGTQHIQKWHDLWGLHRATTHMVVDADQWPIHWDEKDLTHDGVKYIHDPKLD